MAYFGGKGGSGVYQRLINEIPPHFVYLEPCLGGGAVLKHKRPALLNIGIDRDAAAVDAFRSGCFDDPELLRLIVGDGVDFIERTFRAAEQHLLSAPVDGLFRFGRYVVPAERVFVYFDPPYPLATRKSGERYLFEWSDEFHLRLLRLLQRLPCRVMVSSYPNAMYADALKSWRTFTFEAATRGGMATEQVWMNYAEPSELHDYRFLGVDRREREKLTRRRRSLLRKLKAMPPIERNALLAEVLPAVLPVDNSSGERLHELYRLFDTVGAVAFSQSASLDAAAVDRDWPKCRRCGDELMVGESGLLCLNGCGKVQPVSRYFLPSEFRGVAELRSAFPEKCLG